MDPAPSLAEAVPAGAAAYLVTVGTDGHPHTVPTTATAGDGTVVVRGPGRRTRANVAAGGVVTVLWSPADATAHTLIVDGTGELRDDTLLVRPVRAVLHRPADVPVVAADGACGADCLEVSLR